MAKTVYIGIVGDIIHPGIINIINEGAKRGEVTVGLLSDKAIVNHKRLPYLSYEQRKTVVENIKGVSKVVVQEDWSYVPNLIKLKPDYIIHGDDWKSGAMRRIREDVYAVMKSQGGEVIEIPYTKGIDSSALVENAKRIGTTPEVRMKTLRRLIAAKKRIRDCRDLSSKTRQWKKKTACTGLTECGHRRSRIQRTRASPTLKPSI